jgi:hypothetical protein
MALKHQPRNVEALQNLGIALMLSEQPAKAAGYLQQAVELETIPKWKEKLQTWMIRAQEKAASEKPTLGLPGDDEPATPAEDLGTRNTKPLQETTPAETGSSGPSQARPASQHGLPDSSFERRSNERIALKPPFSNDGIPSSAAYENVGTSTKNLTGDWDASYMGRRVRMSVLQHVGKRVSGALRISNPGGVEEVYSFSGTFDRGDIRVSHRDGHSFRGTLSSDGKLAGVLRMRNGQEISVNLSKH